MPIPSPPEWIATGRPASAAAWKIGRYRGSPYGRSEPPTSSTAANLGSPASRSISAAAAAGSWAGTRIEPRRRGSASSQRSASQSLCARANSAAR